MEMYLNDSTEIIDLRDFHGNKIKEGDLLSWDFYCEYYQKNNNVKDWMKKAIYVVKKHPKKNGFYAEGIHRDLYLHDFRFKYCEIVK